MQTKTFDKSAKEWELMHEYSATANSSFYQASAVNYILLLMNLMVKMVFKIIKMFLHFT